MDVSRLISDRARRIDASGIRRIFELGAKLADPINLSIGQPDFPVPDKIKDAAIGAIRGDRNGYTLTQGIPELRDRLRAHLEMDLGWKGADVLVTSGTSGALTLAALALLSPGDEFIIPDPYFVAYPHLAALADARAVSCDTYPDFRMTAERVEPLITERTKFVLVNTPSNPVGVVLTRQECSDLLDLCRRKNVLLVSDEIYDVFTYPEAAQDRRAGDNQPCCPSPGRFEGAREDVLLVRGMGKSYGVTGWRLGYASGPEAILGQMAKLQQYTFVCAPSMAQWGAIAALDTDMSRMVDVYRQRRDMVVERLGCVTHVPDSGGAFYVFPEIPRGLNLTAVQFVERAIERSVLVIPGSVFSTRDTHFRLSYAAGVDTLERGLDILTDLLAGKA